MHKLSLCCLAAACGAASGFAPMHSAVLGKPASMRAVSKSHRAPALALRMVDVPRITLPSAVTDVLKEQDLKNPNDMTTADYNSYSAAAVGGTLAFMLLLGPLTGIFDISGAVGDFAFSALIGGGALAYAALRKDEAGEYANKFGTVLLETVDKVAEALPK